MDEQIISYKTAILAKEKGFDWDCWKFYNFLRFDDTDHIMRNHNQFDDMHSAPTQALLQKWLREKHEIMINVFDSTVQNRYAVLVSKLFSQQDYFDDKYYDEYEEALEIGLQEALKLI